MENTRNSQYDEYMNSSWKEPARFQRMLASQVYPRLEYFDRVAAVWTGLDVLDLGCGVGFMSEVLAKRGACVTGVEPDEAALNVAREHAATQALDITYTNGIGEHIPLADASVDRIVCVDVLEHVADLKKVTSECRRVLRPGGIFFFDTINRNLMARFMVAIMMEDILRTIPKGGHDPGKFVRPEELKSLLQQSGFTHIGQFVGMGIVGIDRHREFVFGLTRSTRIMYLGYAQ